MTTEAATATDIEYDEREAGIYPSVFTGVGTYEFNDPATQEKEIRWRWTFADDKGEMDTITSRTFAPRSKALKIYSGILGRAPMKGDKPKDLIGKDVQVIYGPNQNGRLTVTDVLPLKTK